MLRTQSTTGILDIAHGRFDASVDRIMQLADEALRQRVDAEMRARHVPNFSVSSEVDPDGRWR